MHHVIINEKYMISYMSIMQKIITLYLKQVPPPGYMQYKQYAQQIQYHTLQDLTVLPTEIFRRCKTHIPSVIILPTESKTEIIRR